MVSPRHAVTRTILSAREIRENWQRPMPNFLRSDSIAADEVHLERVGRKAYNLWAIPHAWRPPFGVIETDIVAKIRGDRAGDSKPLLARSFRSIQRVATQWHNAWPKGIMLRSSAVHETLADRGAFMSRELPADYNFRSFSGVFLEIVAHYGSVKNDDHLAILVQALAAVKIKGHMSNERRVSPSKNKWEWESETTTQVGQGFNSQREQLPSEHLAHDAKNWVQVLRVLRRLGRWTVSLGRGRAHLEWVWDGQYVWVVQLDFEDDAPDEGIEPTTFATRLPDPPKENVDSSGPLRKVTFSDISVPWKKVENHRLFHEVCDGKYPTLFYASGDAVASALASGRDLVSDVARISAGRIVVRCDCSESLADRGASLSRLNLPRTDSVSPQGAVDFIKKELTAFRGMGIATSDVCFILHRFLPALASAWAQAEPKKRTVHVDALWGVPDGLQYLAHDSFEYDIKLDREIVARTRYKSRFIQETEDGSWRERVTRRKVARYRTLNRKDTAEISRLTHRIAEAVGRRVSVMWFSGLHPDLGLGRNVPWFKIEVPDDEEGRGKNDGRRRAARDRALRTIDIRELADIERLAMDDLQERDLVISLDPRTKYYRDDEFLAKVIDVANRKQLPVRIYGSRLGHAFYSLEREGVTTILADMARYSRVRGQRRFGKLVRDKVPDEIQEGGEDVVLASIWRGDSRAMLVAKLYEEAQELLAAVSPRDVCTELADLLEVVRSLAHTTGVGWKEVWNAATEKRAIRGGFEEGVVLMETAYAIPSSISWREPQVVSLRDLGSRGVEGEAAYAELLSSEGGLVRLRDGTRLRIAMGPTGVRVGIDHGEVVDDSQLTLPFFDGNADDDETA